MRTFRSPSGARSHARSRELAVRFGRELRIARVTAGLTQSRLATLTGLTQQHVSLAELGDPNVSLDARCRLAAGCGHELGWRLYPTQTVRLRDSGQLHLAQTIIQALHAAWSHRLEVPISPGDPRAADLVITREDELVQIEVERALVDFQAQLRAAQLKRQALGAKDDRPIRLVIAVPDTSASRARLAPFADLVRTSMPQTSRRIWAALRSGEPLGGDGILFVRAPRRG
jgi:transcriptional regulator with XRE-family HTH domain